MNILILLLCARDTHFEMQTLNIIFDCVDCGHLVSKFIPDIIFASYKIEW